MAIAPKVIAMSDIEYPCSNRSNSDIDKVCDKSVLSQSIDNAPTESSVRQAALQVSLQGLTLRSKARFVLDIRHRYSKCLFHIVI